MHVCRENQHLKKYLLRTPTYYIPLLVNNILLIWKVASEHICDRVSESMLHIVHIQRMLHIVHHHSRRFSAKIRSAITLYYAHYYY
jgi:hypothetical protein